jgi:plastocyanin domain-containing protein
MLNKTAIASGIASLGLALGIASGQAVAQMPHKGMQHSETEQNSQFRRIEQPFWLKSTVTLGGLGLIGLELWWFLLSKPKSQKAQAKQGIQEIDIAVDGGYEPSRVVVNAGQRVRLNFHRKDPSSCLEEVRFPDFHIAQELPLNQTTPIEFTPNKPGTYDFTCGMNMFRGAIEVQGADSTSVAALTPVDPPTHQAQSQESTIRASSTWPGIQEATVVVEKGYQPERVIVEVGQPVRLHFQRHNANKCFDKLLLPDFNLAVDLAPNQTTTVEFTPKAPGEYQFTCGMEMYRGTIKAQASSIDNNGKASALHSSSMHHHS